MASGYEFEDFKIAFSISLRAYLQRYLIIKKAEKVVGEHSTTIKVCYKQSLDFNTVFKWIVSPLVAKKVGKPANLEGQFWVNCNFAIDDQT